MVSVPLIFYQVFGLLERKYCSKFSSVHFRITFESHLSLLKDAWGMNRK